MRLALLKELRSASQLSINGLSKNVAIQMIQNIDDGQQETHATDTVSETPRWTIINISQSAVGFHILRLCTQDKVISNIDIYDHVVVDRDNA